jgi:hypothetical protein
MSERIFAQAGDVVLIIEPDGDAAVFLYTFLPDGFIADNWKPDIDAAKRQAALAVSGFPGGIGAWQKIPDAVTDVMEFGCKLREQSK